MCSSDFNEIVRNLENKGGSNRSHMQMQNFREVINACGFIDMGYKGIPFTWKKLYRDGHSIWERLDRSMATSDWLTQFGGSLVHHLTCSTSNYFPITDSAWGFGYYNPKQTVSAWRNVAFRERLLRHGKVWMGKVKEEPWSNVTKIEDCILALKRWSRKNLVAYTRSFNLSKNFSPKLN